MGGRGGDVGGYKLVSRTWAAALLLCEAAGQFRTLAGLVVLRSVAGQQDVDGRGRALAR